MTQKQIYIALGVGLAVVIGYAWKALENRGCSCSGSSA